MLDGRVLEKSALAALVPVIIRIPVSQTKVEFHIPARTDASVKGTADYWSVNSYVRDMIDARQASMNGPSPADL